MRRTSWGRQYMSLLSFLKFRPLHVQPPTLLPRSHSGRSQPQRARRVKCAIFARTASRFSPPPSAPPLVHDLPRRLHSLVHSGRTRSRGIFSCLAEQLCRKQCPFRRFLMLEVSEDIATGSQVFSDPRDHCTAFFFRVTRLAKSVIDKRSSQHIRSDAFFSLRHAERDSMGLQ